MSFAKNLMTLGLSLALFVQPGIARDDEPSRLRGSFSGSAIEAPTDNPFVFEAAITGAGNASPLGPCKVAATHLVDSRTLAFANGRIAFTGKQGAIFGSYRGQFYPTQTPGVFTLVASVRITGGTGKFRGVTGSGSLGGTVNSNTDSEQFAASIDASIELEHRD